LKRYKDIWQNLCSQENTIRAITMAVANKRINRRVISQLGDGHGGLDPVKVKFMAARLISAIKNDWKPYPCRHIQKRCKSSGKVRDINCPSLFDHCIHWMIILAVKEPLTRGMYKYSCGSIPKRGIEYARKTVEKWTQNGEFKYFVKLDVTKFYNSIDHDVLKNLFRNVIKDKRVLKLLDLVVDTIPKGIPIGSYTSQWFANFYLQNIDHFIKQELYKIRRDKRINYVKNYLRYMDDMLLTGMSKHDLEKAVRAVQTKLHDEYKVQIKNAWEIKNIDEHPIDIVGYRFYKTHTVLRKQIFLRTKRLAKKIYKIKIHKNIIRLHDAQGMISSIGWAKHCNNKRFYKKYIKPYINIKELKGVISYESRKQYSTKHVLRI